MLQVRPDRARSGKTVVLLTRVDDQGERDFRYEVLHATDDTAYVRGWTIYEDGVVGNLRVARFA